jgi:hypothetical protein
MTKIKKEKSYMNKKHHNDKKYLKRKILYREV